MRTYLLNILKGMEVSGFFVFTHSRVCIYPNTLVVRKTRLLYN
nr:MAG TPA: hypothetical protein [Caudoviricetes sp.]